MQQYVTTETTYFLDSVRNLGYLTKNMYDQYKKNIELGNNLYEIELTHYHVVYYAEVETELSNGTKGYECYYTSDILTSVYNETNNYCYTFNQNDYVTIKVRRKTTSLAKRMQQLILGRSEERRVGKECASTSRYGWWSSE